MCTFEYPFGDIDVPATEIKIRVTSKEPDYTKIPGEYSEKTIDFIKLFLTKDRKS